MKFYKKFNFAFSLAEVLISLGILGVVAAITMPALIKNYQIKSYAVNFKKHYSLLQNAINYLQTEENIKDCYVYYPAGSSTYLFKTEDCKSLYDGVIEKLTLTKISYPNNLYNSQNTVLANGGRVKNNSIKYENYLKYLVNVYLFKDGAVLIFCYSPTAFGAGNAYWVLDINGQKGPNKWGYDVFFLTLTADKNGAIKLGDSLASIKEKGGFYPNEMLLK